MMFVLVFLCLVISAKSAQFLVVDCLSNADNNGRYLVNTYFTDTSKGWRSQTLYGTCSPGTFKKYTLNEPVNWVWIKGLSKAKAYIRVSTVQDDSYVMWKYGSNTKFVVSHALSGSGSTSTISKCFGVDGRDGNGYCELAQGEVLTRRTTTPYQGTVYDISLPSLGGSTFTGLTYVGQTSGGAVHGHYWDYRHGEWRKDMCYTYTASFSDGVQFEVTTPVADHDGVQYGVLYNQMVDFLTVMGTTPSFLRDWLTTIALNGDGPGSRAGANAGRKSMTINLDGGIRNNAQTLILHEDGHVALKYIQDHTKWKTAQKLDTAFISSYAKNSPGSEDVSESFVPWLKVKMDPESTEAGTIKETIPYRLAVFDDLICSKHPLFCLTL